MTKIIYEVVSIQRFLEHIKDCDPKEFSRRFHLDNFPTSFHGDSGEILPKLQNAFSNSPSEDGFREKWELDWSAKKGSPESFGDGKREYDIWVYTNRKGCHIYLRGCKSDRAGRWLRSNELVTPLAEVYLEYHFGGREEAVSSAQEPYSIARSFRDVTVDIGELILREGIVGGFPGVWFVEENDKSCFRTPYNLPKGHSPKSEWLLRSTTPLFCSLMNKKIRG